MTRSVRFRAGLFPVIVALAVLGTGCGASHASSSSSSSSSTSTSTSTPSSSAIPSRRALAAAACVKSRAVLRARLRVSAHAVAGRLVKTSDGSPQCDFRVAAHPALLLWVSLDNGPQPYQVLDRRSVEEGQNFAFMKHFKEPQSIPGLGLTGWWFPREQQLATTDGRILITVTIVGWPQHGTAPRKALSATVARAYLGPLLRGARLVAD